MRSLPDTSAAQLVAKAAAASGADATVTITGTANEYIVIDSILWSYDSAPTNGLLTITATGLTTITAYVTAGGPGQLVFPNSGLAIPVGADVSVKLDDGTAAKHIAVFYR